MDRLLSVNLTDKESSTNKQLNFDFLQPNLSDNEIKEDLPNNNNSQLNKSNRSFV